MIATRRTVPPGAWVVLLFLAAAVGLFHDAVLGGRQFFYRDLTLQWHPQVEAFVRSVGAGSWPLWNPYISFGQVLLANPNNALLYPFTWLNLVMGAWTYYTCYTVFHFVLAGVGAYVLGRHLGFSRAAAVVSGLVWVLSGPFLSLVNLWNHLAAIAWVPWIVRAGDRLLERPDWRRGLTCGALFALPVLCGSPEMGAIAAVLLGALAVGRVREWRREPRGLARVAGAGTLALAVALALSAGQWLPSLEVASHSMRAQMPSWARDFWSLHPASLAQVVFPVFADQLPLHGTWRARWFESREPYLVSLYVGASAGALFLAGLANGRGRRWVWAVGTVTVLAAVLALGHHTPLYDLLLTLVPPLKTLRFPAKAMILFSFGAALVAGHGFDAWRERRGGDIAWSLLALAGALAAVTALGGALLLANHAEEWGSALLLRGRKGYTEALAPTARALFVASATAAVVAVAALLNRLRARPGGPVLAYVVAAASVLELVLAQRGLNPTAPRSAFAATPPALTAARPAPHQRLFVFDYTRPGTAPRLLQQDRPFVTALREEDWEPWHGAFALRDYLYPSFLAVWGVEGSFSTDAVKLLSADVMTLNALIDRQDGAPDPVHRLLRLGAVDTVVALHEKGFEELTPVAVLPSLMVQPMYVYRVPDPLPRAYVVGRGRIAPVGQGWRAITADDFDPTRSVVLPGGPVLDSDATGTARIADFRPDRMEVDVEASGPAYLVTVDAYDSGWRAAVDGRPAPLLRANVAFRAVEVPGGRHRVSFVYRPTSVTVGVTVSLLAVAGLLAVAASALRPPRGQTAA